MKKSHRKWFWISVLFSTAVLAVVLYFTIDETTVTYLSRIDPLYLGIALGMHMSALAIWAQKIRTMAKSLGYNVSFSHCLNMINANLLIAAVTPSQAGGEPVRIHELYAANVKFGDATAIVITERILDGIILALAGALTIFMLGTMSLSSWYAIIVFGAWIVVLTIVAIFVITVKNPDRSKRLIYRCCGPIVRKWYPSRLKGFKERIDSEVDNFNSSVTLFVKQGRSGLLWGAFYTALFWSFEFLTPSFILMGLGAPPYFIQSFIAQILIAIVMMVPLTPGGSGVAEVSAYSLYALFVASSIVGVFVVLWRVIFYYFNILLGIFSTIPILRRKMGSLSPER